MTRIRTARTPVRYDLDVTGWDLEELRGVGRLEGKTVFCQGAIPGERVLAERIRSKKTYEEARAVEVGNPSPLRVEPECPHFGMCGGCSLQHIHMPAQIAIKQRLLEEQFRRIGGVSPETVFPPIQGPSWRYRDRCRMSVRNVRDKGVLVGFRERRSGYVARMDECPVLPKIVSDLVAPVKACLSELDAKDGIPQIEWSCGESVTVMAVRHMEPLSPGDLGKLKDFVSAHDKPGARLQLWLQPGKLDSLHPVWPDSAPDLDYVLPEWGLRMSFQPQQFTQVNRHVNRTMLSRAMRLLEVGPGDKVLDLFCGLGNFSLPAARAGASVIGVEGSAELVRSGFRNAELNGLADRCRFEVANLFDPAQLPLEHMKSCSKWIVDPPRDGAHELVKAVGGEISPERIVYVSCKPATLARDAGVLAGRGYRVLGAGVMNMFPHTTHTEAIALFVKARTGENGS